MSPSSTQIFPEVSPSNLRLIANHGVTRTYPKSTVLINEGEVSHNFYVILDGKVKIYASDEDGKEIILNIQKSGDYFGELALVDDAPRSASVITLEQSRMSVVSNADFYRCLSEHPELAVELIRPLVQKVRALTDNVKNLALYDVYGRITRTLLNLAVEQQGQLMIEQRLTHQDIANMVGASREMVSRIMKELKTGAYIRVQNQKITIQGKLPSKF